jgi:site-specific recombinase XerD
MTIKGVAYWKVRLGTRFIGGRVLRKHFKTLAGVISVAEAIEKAVVRKQSRRPTYLANLKTRWRHFERWLPRAKKKALHMITQADIRAFLNHCKLKPKGEDNEKRNLSVPFGWAVQHHYIAANPCKGIACESGDEEKNPPRMLTIPQVVQILTLAQKEVVQPLLVAKNEIAILDLEQCHFFARAG